MCFSSRSWAAWRGAQLLEAPEFSRARCHTYRLQHNIPRSLRRLARLAPSDSDAASPYYCTRRGRHSDGWLTGVSSTAAGNSRSSSGFRAAADSRCNRADGLSNIASPGCRATGDWPKTTSGKCKRARRSSNLWPSACCSVDWPIMARCGWSHALPAVTHLGHVKPEPCNRDPQSSCQLLQGSLGRNPTCYTPLAPRVWRHAMRVVPGTRAVIWRQLCWQHSPHGPVGRCAGHLGCRATKRRLWSMRATCAGWPAVPCANRLLPVIP
jgi:hypothetical protein